MVIKEEPICPFEALTNSKSTPGPVNNPSLPQTPAKCGTHLEHNPETCKSHGGRGWLSSGALDSLGTPSIKDGCRRGNR